MLKKLHLNSFYFIILQKIKKVNNKFSCTLKILDGESISS